MTDKKQKYLTLPLDVSRISADDQPAMIDFLKAVVTPERAARLEKVVAQRTRHVTVALENIHKPHNASAILRSCDSFGVQDLHIIDTYRQYAISNTTTSGAHQWVTQHFYHHSNNRQNVANCFASLRESGYRVMAMTLREDAVPVHELPVEDRVALLFGTELFGLTEEAHALADGWVQVPMLGFTDSLNVSVAAAIAMQNLSSRARSAGIAWQLDVVERNALLIQWLLNSIEQPEAIVARFFGQEEEGA
jgi:tRNA (guanosine-2'-O-)-methyltransferase